MDCIIKMINLCRSSPSNEKYHLYFLNVSFSCVGVNSSLAGWANVSSEPSSMWKITVMVHSLTLDLRSLCYLSASQILFSP